MGDTSTATLVAMCSSSPTARATNLGLIHLVALDLNLYYGALRPQSAPEAHTYTLTVY